MPDSNEGAIPGVVIDTSVFVAAAFRPRSDSGRIVEAVRAGRLRFVWDEPTRGETERVLRKIPPIDWESVSSLFSEGARFRGETEPARFTSVPDQEDRKFASLASAAGVPLVTLDRPLLGAVQAKGPVPGLDADESASDPPSFVALRPGAFLRTHLG